MVFTLPSPEFEAIFCPIFGVLRHDLVSYFSGYRSNMRWPLFGEVYVLCPLSHESLERLCCI